MNHHTNQTILNAPYVVKLPKEIIRTHVNYSAFCMQGGLGWEERVTGAATLTKDYGRKSYFIQIFDMQYCQQVKFYQFFCAVENSFSEVQSVFSLSEAFISFRSD